MNDDVLFTLSYYVGEGAVKLELSDFTESGPLEFLQASLILKEEREKRKVLSCLKQLG